MRGGGGLLVGGVGERGYIFLSLSLSGLFSPKCTLKTTDHPQGGPPDDIRPNPDPDTLATHPSTDRPPAARTPQGVDRRIRRGANDCASRRRLTVRRGRCPGSSARARARGRSVRVSWTERLLVK
eukprot:1126211-Prymnesium_polylepis.1